MSKHTGRVYLFIMAAAIVASVITAGCGGGGGGGVAATANGTVRDDASLQGIASVDVTSGGASTTSDQDGAFSLSTTSGTRALVFSAADYVRQEVTPTLGAGANNVGTIYLAPALLTGKGAVQGTVYQAGTPLGGAIIQSGTAQAISKADGGFGIYNVSPGQQVLTAVSPDTQFSGYAVVQVAAGETLTGVTIDLSLAPPGPPIF